MIRVLLAELGCHRVIIRLWFSAWLVLSAAAHAAATEARNLNWDDLVPRVQKVQNPFESLEFRQTNDLAKLYRLEASQNNTTSEFTKSQAVEIRARLKADGLDPDWLFKQRERLMQEHTRQASAPNPEVIAQIVRVPGYIIPLEMKGTLAVEFLLVPTVGACIHTPPPDANQMIHVRYPDGYQIRGLYDPVWIIGELQAEKQVELVTLSDGQLSLETTYSMKAEGIEQHR
ncbi:DUF3299 domain-containing protein [Phaeobacter gallaeciensis]|uniref:DUF3299 domain-containing protein n=2 Tax=Roseobacteraceae TaxID=2854170 RepID=A0A366XCS2_9RHOB|nr:MULTISPECIES: DUF3299 domain-containing protein [Roseobacteraceae]MBT3143194.1 DUF3299 domain-containing protein [Falsiruegeria litorea]RBW60950.1 DUF3299 domain-containing protein [Phaeobacter gallaeciensis]